MLEIWILVSRPLENAKEISHVFEKIPKEEKYTANK
jgi:hypothetical protein